MNYKKRPKIANISVIQKAKFKHYRQKLINLANICRTFAKKFKNPIAIEILRQYY